MLKNTIICNLCGEEFDMWDRREDFSIHRRCGYGTKYDGATVHLDICCKCMEELIEECIVSPIEDCEG